MSSQFIQKLAACGFAVFLCVGVFAADTNAPLNTSSEWTNDLRSDLVTAGLLQIQEQLHNTQLAIQENQQVASALARNNSDLIAAHLQSLEQSMASQRADALTEAHRTMEWTLALTGIVGLLGLGILFWMVSLQSRAFAQLTRIATQQNVMATSLGSIPLPPSPSRGAVEMANNNLLDAVGELKKRVSDLEGSGTPLISKPMGGERLASVSNGNGHLPGLEPGKVLPKAELLSEAQRLMDVNNPGLALEMIENFLIRHPRDTDVLLKKADALQKAGRNDEALDHYNQVIASDNTLALAHLQKGGLLNRLRRYDEALNCYEQALMAQERKRR